jgi:hypothetical protein
VQGQGFRVEGCNLSVEAFKAHGRGNIGPRQQPVGAGQGDGGEAGGARRAIEDAQAFLGLQHERFAADTLEGFGAGEPFTIGQHVAFAEQ